MIQTFMKYTFSHASIGINLIWMGTDGLKTKSIDIGISWANKFTGSIQKLFRRCATKDFSSSIANFWPLKKILRLHDQNHWNGGK